MNETGPSRADHKRLAYTKLPLFEKGMGLKQLLVHAQLIAINENSPSCNFLQSWKPYVS